MDGRQSAPSAVDLAVGRIDLVREGRSAPGVAAEDVERIDVLIGLLAEARHGIVTRRMLLDAGVTAAAIDHRVRVGRLRTAYRGVYSVGHRPLTSEALAMAAVLACGPGAALSHGSAAALWRILTGAAGVPEVLRSGANREGPAGVRLRRTSRIEATIHRDVPVTTPARTLLDLAATGSAGRLELALNEAQGLHLVTRTELEALATSGRPGSRSIRALLADGPGFTRHEAERRLKSLILRAQLPRPLTNTRVCGHEADAYWPKHRLVVEVDGYAAHGRRGAFERDRRLDQQRAAAGYHTIRLTWRQITGEPEAVVARLAGALARS